MHWKDRTAWSTRLRQQLGTPNCHVSRLWILHSLAQVKLVEGERGGHGENFQAYIFLMFLGVWEWNLNEP